MNNSNSSLDISEVSSIFANFPNPPTMELTEENPDEKMLEDLFFIDKQGDVGILEMLGHEEGEVLVPGEEFISIQQQSNRKRRGKGKRKGKGKKGKNQIERVDRDDSEIIQDYIENSDPLVGQNLFEGLSEDLEMYHDDIQDEAALFHELMLAHDDSVSGSSSEYDSDEENAAILGLKLRQTHLFDLDNEEDFIRQDFVGGSNTWDDNHDSQKDAEKARFLKQLNGELSLTDEDEDLEDIGESMNQRRKHFKMQKRARKIKQKEQWAKLKGDSASLYHILETQSKVVSNDLVKYLQKTNAEMYCFVQDPNKQEYSLGNLPGAVRKMINTMALSYNLKLRKRGKGLARRLVIYRTHTTRVPSDWKNLPNRAAYAKGPRIVGPVGKHRGGPATPKKGKGGKSKDENSKQSRFTEAVTPRIGQAVGHGAAPVSDGNVGHRMMKLMGWNPGESLGASNDGIVDPVQVIIRKKKAGLGLL